MQTSPFGVDRAYVVSVRALRKVLQNISSPTNKWWIEELRDDSVVIAHDRLPEAKVPGIEVVSFSFPRVADIPLFPDKEEGEIVCLSPLAKTPEKTGLYMQGEQLLADDFSDWEPFWEPIEAGLTEYHAGLTKPLLRPFL